MKATMGSFDVVVVGPGGESVVALFGVRPVSAVGPLAHGGLNEAFGLAIGLRRVRACATVLKTHLAANLAKAVGAITAAVIGEQSADGDAMASKKVNGFLEKGDGGVGLLIGEDLGESHARVIVDGDMQGFPTRMFVLSAASAVTAPNHLLEAAEALDIEMKQVSGEGMFVTHHGWGGMQIAPAAEPGAAQNAADGCGTESGLVRDVIGRTMLPTKFKNEIHPARRSGFGAVMRTRGAIA